MAKRKEDTPPAGSPAWMATFSDLMNLLLCFFVLLFSMSSVEESKLAELVAAMNDSFSVFDGGATSIGEGILISNGISQLNELDRFINSTGKAAENDAPSNDLKEEGKPPTTDEMIEAIKRLTKEKGYKEEVYINGVLNHSMAKAVKNADRIDNLYDLCNQDDERFWNKYMTETQEFFCGKFSKELDELFDRMKSEHNKG